MKIKSVARLSGLLLIVFLSLVIYGCNQSGTTTQTPSEKPLTTEVKKLPEVISLYPQDKSVGISLNATIEAVFTSLMNPATFTLNTFTLQQGTNNIQGSITCSGTRATFKPDELLSYSTTYSATLTTEVKDTTGLSMGKERVWTFTTINKPETKTSAAGNPSSSTILVSPLKPTTSIAANVTVTPTLTPAPEVISVSPVDKSTNIQVNTVLEVNFSKDMDPQTINSTTFKLQQGLNIVPVSVTCSGSMATLKPTASLSYQLTYTAIITTEVKDLAGRSILADYKWTFITAAAPIYGGFSGGSVISPPSPTSTIKEVIMYDSDLPAPPTGMTFHFISADQGDPGPGKIKISYLMSGIFPYTYSVWFGVENHKLWVYHLPKRETVPASLVSFYDSLGINQYTTYTENDQKYWFDKLPPWLNLAKYDPNITKMPDLSSIESGAGTVKVSYIVNY